MKKVILAVRDSAVRAFNNPFFVPTMEVGVRSFYDEVKRQGEDNQMARHPEDFELWCLGNYDDESGLFEQNEPVRLVARAKDVGA